MRAVNARIGGCLISLLAGYWIFAVPVTGWILLCAAFLSLFYVVIKPLAQLIILPLDMFLFGLGSLALDALLVMWAAAWTPGVALSYPQSLCIAAMIAACYLPYAHMRKRELSKGLM